MSNRPILIVDDDDLLCNAVATALTLNGYSNRSASDGREALAAIQDERPALVLLDLQMPVLDGVGLLRELAARGIELPIVLMTALDDGVGIAREYGVAAYLRKPIAIPRLLAAIAACGPIRDGGTAV